MRRNQEVNEARRHPKAGRRLRDTTAAPATAPRRRRVWRVPTTTPSCQAFARRILVGPYRLYNVPDDLKAAEQERDRVRAAAVEFGTFRRQFTGSTQFWIDENRTELAKSRYAMDEPLWRALCTRRNTLEMADICTTRLSQSVLRSWVWRPAPARRSDDPAAAPSLPIVKNLLILTAPADKTPVPASRQHVTPAPRVIAGETPLYDAAESVKSPPSTK